MNKYHILSSFYYSLFISLVLPLASAIVYPEQKGVRGQTFPNTDPSHKMSIDTASVTMLNELAGNYLYNKPDSTIFFALQAVDMAGKVKFPSGEAWALNHIGNAYYIKGSYHKSLKAYVRSRAIFETLGNKQRVAWALNNMGLIYLSQGDYDDALKQYLGILKHDRIEQDSVLLATAYFNAGLCHYYLQKLDLALLYLDSALVTSKKAGAQRMIVMALNRIGETYVENRQFKEAIVYYRKVIANKQYKNNWETSFAHGGLSRALFEIGQTEKAIVHGLLSYELVQTMQANWDATRVLKVLSDAYAEKGDYKRAYTYHLLFKQHSDSLFSKSKEKEINRLRLRHTESENNELTKENAASKEENRLNRFLIYIISIMALFLIILVYRVLISHRHQSMLNKALQLKNNNIARQKQMILEQNDVLETLNRTKDKLLSILSHDLKSPMASIMSTLHLIRMGALTSEEQTKVFNGLNEKVITVSQLLDNMLSWANSQQMKIEPQFSRVDLLASIKDVLAVGNFLAEEKDIQIIKHNLTEKRFIYADLNHVRIIIQNVLGNAIKFTFKGGRINVLLTENITYVILHVIDNGIGMPGEKVKRLFNSAGSTISDTGTDYEAGTGIGMMLVAQFINENKGKVEVISEEGKGTEVQLFFRKFHTITQVR